MSFKKFEKGDLLFNTIKTKPRFEFKIYNGNIYLNNSTDGYAKLHDLGLEQQQCGAENVLDFSCPETSYNIGLI